MYCTEFAFEYSFVHTNRMLIFSQSVRSWLLFFDSDTALMPRYPNTVLLGMEVQIRRGDVFCDALFFPRMNRKADNNSMAERRIIRIQFGKICCSI
jgi:hypothetical protein